MPTNLLRGPRPLPVFRLPAPHRKVSSSVGDSALRMACAASAFRRRHVHAGQSQLAERLIIDVRGRNVQRGRNAFRVQRGANDPRFLLRLRGRDQDRFAMRNLRGRRGMYLNRNWTFSSPNCSGYSRRRSTPPPIIGPEQADGGARVSPGEGAAVTESRRASFTLPQSGQATSLNLSLRRRVLNSLFARLTVKFEYRHRVLFFPVCGVRALFLPSPLAE